MGERDEDFEAIDARRNALLKASAPPRPDPQASIDANDDSRIVVGRLLEPPYDPLALCTLLEHSNALRQNVDAYCTNIDGFGHRFEPAFDLSADDSEPRVRRARSLLRRQCRVRADVPQRRAVSRLDRRVRSGRFLLGIGAGVSARSCLAVGHRLSCGG